MYEYKLMTHLADNMRRRGKIVFENHYADEYCCVDVYGVLYHGYEYEIISVDALVCRIEKKGIRCTKK